MYTAETFFWKLTFFGPMDFEKKPSGSSSCKYLSMGTIFDPFRSPWTVPLRWFQFKWDCSSTEHRCWTSYSNVVPALKVAALLAISEQCAGQCLLHQLQYSSCVPVRTADHIMSDSSPDFRWSDI